MNIFEKLLLPRIFPGIECDREYIISSIDVLILNSIFFSADIFETNSIIPSILFIKNFG